ncbi:hypothetical protein DFH08DRAFT_850072 [Mycena albidolilacea]|uniref:Uncharacterized protein n=1 Tax=Mycena albidolilacea TaxID=1033008 RepID=A0AAD7EX12_9AGAR|nr:hypothetical protein DFH08DRAFT_850072 [Mycena albidolilacea]
MLVQLVSLFAFAASSLAVPVADITSLGYLRCSSEGQVTGYLSKSLNSAGEYKGVSPDSDPNDVNHRMLVSLDVTATGTQSLLVKNAPDNDYPFLGGIGGEEGSTIGSNGDYLHVGGTELTASGAKPSYCGNTYTDRTNNLRKCESAVWVYNSTTSEVTPRWTNDDGSVVDANIGYVDASFVLTGDKKEFEDSWSDSVEWITLTFET